MDVEEPKIQVLKRKIEEIREKLNMLVDQNVPDINAQILDTSRKLDMLIKDYYNLKKGKV